MFDEKIKEIEANIGTLNADITNKTMEVKNALESNDLEKARTIKAEIEEAKNNLDTAKADLELYKTSAEQGGAEN
ncbi:phage major capsid protein, partial [Streptococcus agalactiae]